MKIIRQQAYLVLMEKPPKATIEIGKVGSCLLHKTNNDYPWAITGCLHAESSDI